MRLPSGNPEPTVVLEGGWLPGYEFLGVVGAGGFGKVFKARQLKLDRVVAVKLIQFDKLANPASAARFENEAIALAKLHHPNIVQVHDYGCHDLRTFLVMELLEGEDLGQRLGREGKLSERLAWAIARQAAAALAHAAAHGIIHRDIKPANLFLSPPPTGTDLPADVPMVKVTDFGLALAKWSLDPSHDRLTKPGLLLGTPTYMAPEQYDSAAELDHRADIYALGATLFHALTGRPPFDGATIWDVMGQKRQHVPALGPDVSRETSELIGAMMVPDARERVGTYEELIDRIDRLSPPRGRAAAAVVPRCPAVPATAARKWRGWAAAVVGVLTVGAVVGVAVDRNLTSLRQPAGQGSLAAVRYVSTQDHEALFNAQSIQGWRPPSAGGVWGVEDDDEGVLVLSGTGFIRRPFAPLADYRITIGLDVHQAAAAEVHFALPARPSDGAKRLVLRVSRGEGAVFGVKQGDKGMFRPLAQPLPFPPEHWFKDRRPYLEVRFGRAGGVWKVWFNGQVAGQTADDATPKAAELLLFAESGQARVDTAILEPLERKEG